MNLFECCRTCTIRSPGCECDQFKSDKAKLADINRIKNLESNYNAFVRCKRVRASRRLGGVRP